MCCHLQLSYKRAAVVQTWLNVLHRVLHCMGKETNQTFTIMCIGSILKIERIVLADVIKCSGWVLLVYLRFGFFLNHLGDNFEYGLITVWKVSNQKPWFKQYCVRRPGHIFIYLHLPIVNTLQKRFWQFYVGWGPRNVTQPISYAYWWGLNWTNCQPPRHFWYSWAQLVFPLKLHVV